MRHLRLASVMESRCFPIDACEQVREIACGARHTPGPAGEGGSFNSIRSATGLERLDECVEVVGVDKARTVHVGVVGTCFKGRYEQAEVLDIDEP